MVLPNETGHSRVRAPRLTAVLVFCISGIFVSLNEQCRFIERYVGRGLQRSAKPLLYPKVPLSSCPHPLLPSPLPRLVTTNPPHTDSPL